MSTGDVPSLPAPLLEKLTRLEVETSRAQGEYTFFGMVLRDEGPEAWDLVVSAPWVARDEAGAVRYLAAKLGEILTTEELLTLSRIVPLEDSSPLVATMHRAFRWEHKTGNRIARLSIMTDRSLAEFPIESLYIVTCGPEGEPRTLSQAERAE